MRLSLLFFLIACLLPACQINDSQATTGSTQQSGHRSAVIQAFRDHGKMLVVYEDEDSVYAPLYQNWWQAKAQEIDFVEILVRPASEVQESELIQHPVFFVGSLTHHPLLRKWLPQLPVQATPEGFLFLDRPYNDPDDVVAISMYPHPEAQPFPMGFLTGNDEKTVYQHLVEGRSSGGWAGLPWGNWNFEVYKGTERICMGMYTEAWTIDKAQFWNWEDESEKTLRSTHFQFVVHQTHFSQTELESLRDTVEKRYQAILDFFAADQSLPLIQYHLFESAEAKAMQFDNMDQAHLDFKQSAVYTLISPDYRDNYLEKENQLLVREILGEPTYYAWEEGLGTWFAPRWQQKGWRHWAGRLAASGFHYSLTELMDDRQYQRQSEMLRSCMAAALVDFLLETWGKTAFLERYQTETIPESWAQLEPLWQAYLSRLSQEVVLPASYAPDLPAYHKGMTFAHEGYLIYNGYGSALARESIDSLAHLSVNALAIVPYSGSRQIHEPSEYRVSTGSGGENDASVVHAHHAAQKRGMITLLKPQIWFPGSWPGDLEMQNEADWERFFHYYRRWITHYAMLAEIHHMEVFSVGVEFTQATIQHPEAWRKLVQDLRNLYRGAITYSANWGDEIERLAFGESLDFIGVNCYYPLSQARNPSDEMLLKGAEQALDRVKKVADKFQKPVLLTEVGFRSISSPWEHPHDEPNGQAFDEQAQARCYAALLHAVAERPWIKGLYWWKWPSFMQYSNARNTSFTPCGKEAAEVLRNWYRKTY